MDRKEAAPSMEANFAVALDDGGVLFQEEAVGVGVVGLALLIVSTELSAPDASLPLDFEDLECQFSSMPRIL